MRGGERLIAADPAIWDALAARYGAQERLESRAIEVLLRLAAVGPGDRVLDLATGTGIVPRTLARRLDRPRELLAVDRSSEMLARIGELPDGWRAELADAAAVEVDDATTDVVTAAYLLHLLDPGERAAVLAEAHRVLAPGGRIVVATPWVDGARPAGALVHAALRAAAALAPSRLGGLRPLDPTADLRAAGFEPTRRGTLNRGGYPTLVLRASKATSPLLQV